MATYSAESFYRGTIRQSVANNTSVPFTLKVSKIPTLTSWLLTISPNTANEEIVEYSGVDWTALTIIIVKRWISPSAQALTVNWTDYNNVTYQKSHSQNDAIRWDVNHLHIIQDYWSLQSQINAKVDTAWWLRTTMGASRQALEVDATWAEVKKAIVDWTTISSTETIRKRKSDGTYEEIPYSFIENASLLWQSQDVVAWEALTTNDAVIHEYQLTTFPSWGLWYWKYLQQKMGDVAGNTRLSMNIIGNWVSMSSLKLWLAKNGSPTDNVVVRIETDSAWVPSWTLAHANATANIAWTWLTTTLTDTTVTFWWAFTLTNNTVYHVVIQRQGVLDASNYYFVVAVTKNVRCFKRNVHNGTSWWTASNVASLYVWAIAWVYTKVVVKTVANLTELAAFDWIATSTVSLWASTKINREWLMSWLSWLTDWAAYFLSNTPWAIATTPWTTIREVWYAVWATKLYIKNPLYNPSNYEFVIENPVSVINETWTTNSWNTSYTCRAIAKWRIWFWCNTTWLWNTLYVYVNNTLVRSIAAASIPVVFHDIYPWDLITAMFVHVGNNYWRVVQFQQLLAPITRSE